MAETKRIRVKQIEAADPKVTVTLESADNGTFPAYVKVHAHLTDSADGGDYQGDGTATGGGLTVVVVVPFTDPNYPTETTLHYALTVYFSPDNRSWTQVPTNDVAASTGDVTATHGDDADAMVVEETGAAGGGAKNKGCLAIFGLLPF